MPNWLAMETSSPILSIAVKKGPGQIRERKVKGSLRHAEQLIPSLDRLLKSQRLHLSHLNTYLLGLGPGSFTGLRVGFSTLKGLLAAHPGKCYGATSLDLIAFGIDLPMNTKLAICLDGSREKIYFRLYENKKSGWKAKEKAAALSLSQVLEKFPEEVYVAGNAAGRYREALATNIQSKKIHFLPEQAWYPSAHSLVKMFETKSPFLRPLIKPKDFVPFYLRLSEAEERRMAHAG